MATLTDGRVTQTLIEAMYTEATCGEACWCAREDVCRCSCGGKNHGILRTADGQRPERTAKIDGSRYVLLAVGCDGISEQARTLNRANGPRRVDKITDTLTYTYFWEETDKHAPARVKPASKDQVARWPELTAWRTENRYFNPVYLLWKRQD